MNNFDEKRERIEYYLITQEFMDPLWLSERTDQEIFDLYNQVCLAYWNFEGDK